MAAYEVLLLNTAIPQIQAAQSGDTYVVPRDIAFSTVAKLADGTAAIPALSFSNDPDTGLFSAGANILGFAANGAEKAQLGASSFILRQSSNAANTSVSFNTTVQNALTLDSSGNLGLGVTPSGSFKLEVAGGDASIYGVTVGRGAGAVSTNTAVGASALSTNSTGAYNVAIGYESLKVNTASRNTAVGYQAGYSVIESQYNAYLGYGAGYGNTGDSNVGVGDSALSASGSAVASVAIGQGALSATTGNYNTAVGYNSGAAITTGSKNTILGGYTGNYGGLDIRTASNYIVLSDGDGNPRGVFDNNSYFVVGGTTAYGQITSTKATSNQFVANASQAGNGVASGYWFYNQGTSKAYIYHYSTDNALYVQSGGSGGVYLNPTATSWTSVSDETRKVIIEPITDAANKVATLRTVIGRLKTDDETVRRPYLIAQDVQAVLPEAVSESEDKEGPVLGLSYTEVIPLLVAAIKELKSELDSVKAELATLKGA